MKLSILICAIPERLAQLSKLLEKLNRQQTSGFSHLVEVLCLLDNKKRTIAEKRNNLKQMANGDYLCYLDDDDDVADTYLQTLIANIKLSDGVDCITFKKKFFIDGRKFNVSFGLGNPHEGLVLDDTNNYRPILRPPYHMCLYKSDFAKRIDFRQIYNNSGQSVEDIDWLLRLYPLLSTEHHIPEYLHFYIYDSNKSSSRRENNSINQ
jgi:glycosyltransferase involved in cell wall biosynthesis